MEMPLSRRGDMATPAERRWTAALLGMGIGLALGAALMPGVSLERALYLALHGICAQTHNLVAGGFQLPLCARDSGMYLSYLATLGVVAARGRWRAGRLPPLRVSLSILGMFLLMAADGLNSTLAEMGLSHAYEPRNDLRLLTGMGAGVGLALVVLLVLNTALRRDVEDDTRALGGWRDLGVVLAIDALIVGALALDTPLLSVPLALLVTVGVVGNLAVVMMLIPSLALGLGGRVTRMSQLAHPAAIGLILAITFLIALARYRLWLELGGYLPPLMVP
ncbi:DUF2085 domain-containing protein [Oscillochloris sp. ZM17-4]|uniref:DUF2085 domain-containing protein n=1 Tax=Oscillochloris sp. ZM17-4 TaxID=2866714 RepID=UPI001C731F99|nr:DUF2085 domain-containing protein [Oscillochloris sp. ZM17-4]MBX0329835.1 DUF2085 domain-containing protein [Oscillochloris sp. ZM17-4]